jgi:mono/diheme cytochrome c family protein
MSRTLLSMGPLALAVLVTANNAFAADVERGKRMAQEHCAPCHVIAPQTQKVVAIAPPFDAIGRKFDFNAGVIATAIVGPHPKMNFSPGRAEAADIAAYIATLKQ